MCVFSVCLLHVEMRLISLGVRLVSLGVRLKQELGDEFGGEFDEFGRGFGAGAWR